MSVITFYNKVKAIIARKRKTNVFLGDFIWLEQYRPKSKEDIFMQAFYKPELKITEEEEEEE